RWELEVRPASKTAVSRTLWVFTSLLVEVRRTADSERIALRVAETTASAHRHWRDIRALIEGSSLSAAVRHRALRTFGGLAAAEAKIHAADPECVHFHEVGGIDSIVDVVGVSLGLELLEIEWLSCSPVALGAGGTITCEHGTLPVPAPAVLELLVGVPVEAGASAGELTTPTGAALLAANVDSFGPMPDMTLTRVGYGAGTRETPGTPNVARLLLGHALAPGLDAPATSAEGASGPVVLLETLLDHLTPEHVGFITEELRAEGPLDAWLVPAAMKKGRLGIELRVLVIPTHAEKFAARIHELTGSLGVRRTLLSRSVLRREVLQREGPWGAFRVKVSGVGESARVRPEHEDIARASRESGESYAEVRRRLENAAQSREEE
ncbi:MAG: LarC family nickel insertion protein, partial [Actinobacteria bacterium]|nr:LarC family nickel insertion protein [Actinomycetota bacterium]